jgi:ABC-type multidrug transport system ATPase subunit
MLTLTGVTHVYPNGTRALEDATLEIPTGMFGLLGPNGAGKSTLMRCIATLQTPSSGSIVFDGIDVIREPERLRAQLGYLPQDFGVYPRVSAYELLDHLAVLKGVAGKGERRETVETLLDQVNLWSVRKKAVAGYSGGMRQRFGIAQALIGNPRLIIVDEPTAGLDPEERNRFNNLLAEIGENVVVILSTHIVDDVADLCSRMAIIDEGRIVLAGAPGELVERLRGSVWQRAIDKHALGDYQGRMNVISTRLTGGRTVIHVVADTTPEDGFAPVEGELEDLYFATLAARRRKGAAPAATNGHSTGAPDRAAAPPASAPEDRAADARAR